jgi:hypothetical protein
MKTESLENLLREKIATEKPRPGFETRIQAMAREPRVMEKRRGYLWLTGLGIAALAVMALMPREEKPSSTLAGPLSPPELKVALTETRLETPVQKEIEGMKSDARRAFDFLSSTVPSLIEK